MGVGLGFGVGLRTGRFATTFFFLRRRRRRAAALSERSTVGALAEVAGAKRLNRTNEPSAALLKI